jgi:hypothetical protein
MVKDKVVGVCGQARFLNRFFLEDISDAYDSVALSMPADTAAQTVPRKPSRNFARLVTLLPTRKR